jgi:hypothetical protein
MPSSSSSSSNSSSSSIGNPEYGRGVFLRRFVQTQYRNNKISGFRFKVVAYGGNDMTNFIFRYGREALNAREGTYRLAFDGICSPVDLEEFPETEPTVGVFPEFCRLDYIDLVFRSQTEAEETWQIILTEVGNLVYTLDVMDVTVPEQDLKIGNPPPADFPDSSSSAP